MRRSVRYYIFFLVLYLVIHYLEGLSSAGTFSFAQLWKIPVLLYLLWISIQYLTGKTRFENATYWLAIESLFSPETLLNPIASFIYTSKLLPFVLFFRFFYEKFQAKVEVLEKILYAFAQYICLASALTLTGIIKPASDMISAESFGIKNAVYFSGIFGAPHAASSYCCIAILILFNGFLIRHYKSRFSKIFNATLLLVGLIAIFKAYVRTGWLMLVIGLFCLVDFKTINAKRILAYLFCILLGIGGILYFYNNNIAFRNRINGVNIYQTRNPDGIELGGSGRTAFWLNGISNWANNDDIYQVFFGSGYTKVTENNLKTTGMKVFSHNLFVDTLAQHGIIGLMLLLTVFFSLYQFIIRISRGSPYKRLCLGAYWSNVIFAFFQGLMYFDFAIAFAIILSLATLSEDNINERELVRE